MASLSAIDSLNIIGYYGEMELPTAEKKVRIVMAEQLQGTVSKYYDAVRAILADEKASKRKKDLLLAAAVLSLKNAYLSFWDKYYLAYIYAAGGGSGEPYSAADAWKRRRAYDFALWITQTAQREPNLAFSESHAAAVTRTEINAVCNLAAMDAAYRQGKRFKTWKTFGDAKVRPSHKVANGQRVPLDMPFTVGGYEMMFPNDSSLGAPAGEVVNCRCVLEFDDGKVLTNSDERGIIRTGEKLQNDASNDWNGADPTLHTVEELRELNRYALERRIKLYNRMAFDGDIDLLKAQIDTMAKIRADFGHTDFIKFGWKPMNAGDFGETSANHQQIWINVLALRNREITELNMSADNFLAANQATGIVAHEMGHVISGKLKKGITGLDIYKQTVYNVSGKSISDVEAVKLLYKNVSEYSVNETVKANGTLLYDEIVSEMLSLHYTSSNKYTLEFVNLLKGALK